MAAFARRKFYVSSIGGTSFTLTPAQQIGAGGGFNAGDPDLSSGVTTIVVNSAGPPDTSFIRYVNQFVNVTIETQQMVTVEHRGEQEARTLFAREHAREAEQRKRVVEPALERAERREWAQRKYGTEGRWNE